MINLRDYQQHCIEAVTAAKERGITRQLVALPTGAGKTIVFGSYAKQHNGKTLILAHRDELLQQAADKLHLVWPDVDAGYVKGRADEHDKQVVIASVQSAHRDKRLKTLKQYDWDLLIVDEAHHAAANTYRSIIDALGFGKGTDKMLLGVTATPQRADGQGMDSVFDEIVYSLPIETLIRSGQLSDVQGVRVQTSMDLSGVRTQRGDFAEWQLAAVVNTAEHNECVVQAYQEHTQGRKAIAFCVDVQHAKNLAETFQKAGIAAKAVYGDMSADERKEALGAFSEGRITVLTSCAVLTEGFDEPSVEAVLMCRPTKSQTLYIQCVGRGLRTYPGKTECIVLEFTANRQDLCMLPALTGREIGKKSFVEALKHEERAKEREEKEIIHGKHRIDSYEEIDLFGQKLYTWLRQTDGGFRLPIGQQEWISLTPSGEAFEVVYERHDKKKILCKPLPLSYAQGVAEEALRKLVQEKDNIPKWCYGEPVTESQAALLRKIGLPEGDISKLSKGEAMAIIDIYFVRKRMVPATEKQLWLIRKFGIQPKAGLTRNEASAIINGLFKKSEAVARSEA